MGEGRPQRRQAVSGLEPGSWPRRVGLSGLLRGAALGVGLAFVLVLATGGGSLQFGGTHRVRLPSAPSLAGLWVLLLGLALASAPDWRRLPRVPAEVRVAIEQHWPFVLVLVTATALRLTQYLAPPIRLFPYIPVEETFGRFVTTNLFIAAATAALYALGRQCADGGTGLLAAVVFSLSPWVLYFGRFHQQQAAACAAAVGGVLLLVRWFQGSHSAAAAIGVACLAIVLDPLGFHVLGIAALLFWVRSPRPLPVVIALLGAVLAVGIAGRLTFTPAQDLWNPPIPPITTLAVGSATLFILYDRVATILLPAGGLFLFVLGLVCVTVPRVAVVALWVVSAALWTVWAGNRHLAQSAVYFALLAAASLSAGWGGACILAMSSKGPIRRNLGWIILVGLLFSLASSYDYAYQRIYRWNTAVVSDRQAVPVSWLDGFRAIGAWYFVAAAHRPEDLRDQALFRETATRYPAAKRFNRVVFEIVRGPEDYYRQADAALAKSPPLIFEAEELSSQVGRLVPDGAAANGYAIRADGQGAVIYGPYVPYPAGRYTVEFHLRVAGPARGDRVGHVDVATQVGRVVLAARDVVASDFPSRSQYRRLAVSFGLSEPARLEFRVFSDGIAPMWADRVHVQPAAPVP